LIKDGHLFLSLMADGGIYEFEPLPVEAKVTGTVTYRQRIALAPDAMVEVNLVDLQPVR
jgi:Type III secretion system lipoprotein chaperone (YscW)